MALGLRADRSTGRCRAARAPRGCGTGTDRSRRTRPAPGWPSTCRCFSGRCQPRGRTISVATVGFSRYTRPSGLVNSMRRVTASRRLICPPTTLSQVGVIESSQSAMNTRRARIERIDDHLAIGRAGDLDATVLQVGGRRRDPPVAVAHRAGLRQEVRQADRRRSRPGVPRASRSSSATRGPNRRARSATKRSASSVRIVRVFRAHVPGDGAAGRQIERGRCTQVRTSG